MSDDIKINFFITSHNPRWLTDEEIKEIEKYKKEAIRKIVKYFKKERSRAARTLELSKTIAIG